MPIQDQIHQGADFRGDKSWHFYLCVLYLRSQSYNRVTKQKAHLPAINVPDFCHCRNHAVMVVHRWIFSALCLWFCSPLPLLLRPNALLDEVGFPHLVFPYSLQTTKSTFDKHHRHPTKWRRKWLLYSPGHQLRQGVKPRLHRTLPTLRSDDGGCLTAGWSKKKSFQITSGQPAWKVPAVAGLSTMSKGRVWGRV